MKDIYVVVPHGTWVAGAADDFDRASMVMSSYSARVQKVLEVVNVNLLEEGD